MQVTANNSKLAKMKTEFMNLKETATYLRLNIYTIYRMAEQGRIPAMKAGKQWRFSKEELDKWMKKQVKDKRH